MPLELPLLLYQGPLDLRLDRTLGYVYFIARSHPLANKQGKVYLHRHVASVQLGRWLSPGEIVHHRDGNRANNAPENLEVLTPSAHALLHRRPVRQLPCGRCGTFTSNRSFCSRACSCAAKRKRRWPSAAELSRALRGGTCVSVARRYGVSDHTVRRWARFYDVPMEDARRR